jgi:hypothetical protein
VTADPVDLGAACTPDILPCLGRGVAFLTVGALTEELGYAADLGAALLPAASAPAADLSSGLTGWPDQARRPERTGVVAGFLAL